MRMIRSAWKLLLDYFASLSYAQLILMVIAELVALIF
jgi:hypothetical protein